MSSKQAEHKPVVYSLPKNTTLEPQQKLESIIDIEMLQVCPFFCLPDVQEQGRRTNPWSSEAREKTRAYTYTHKHTHTHTYIQL